MALPSAIGRALYITFAALILVLSVKPVFGDPKDDSYPFSTYPMFAAKREAPWFALVEATDESGVTRRLPPEIVGGNDEVMQAAATASRAARSKKGAGRLCKRVGRRLQKSHELSGTQVIRVVRVRYDPVAYFEKGPEPLARQVRAKCKVSPRARASTASEGAL